MLYYINSPGLDVLLGLLLLCVRASASVFARAPFPWQGFKAFSFLSLFSPLSQHLPELRLLRSLFLGPLIDTRQPTSHYGVFHALCFCTLSSSVMLPFLALCELLISKSSPPTSIFFFQFTYTLWGFNRNGQHNVCTPWGGETVGIRLCCSCMVSQNHKTHLFPIII